MGHYIALNTRLCTLPFVRQYIVLCIRQCLIHSTVHSTGCVHSCFCQHAMPDTLPVHVYMQCTGSALCPSTGARTARSMHVTSDVGTQPQSDEIIALQLRLYVTARAVGRASSNRQHGACSSPFSTSSSPLAPPLPSPQ